MLSNNFPVNTTSITARPVGTGPTSPQTEAALSPRLLEILRYRESTRERTPSNATILSDDGRTAASSPSDRSTIPPAYQTSGQHVTGGIMQQFGPVDPVQRGPSTSPSRGSTSASTIGGELWYLTETTLQDRTGPGNGPNHMDGTRGPPESKVTIPKILVHTDGIVPSNDSSFTIVNGSEYQRQVPADVGTGRLVDDVNSREVGDARNGRGDGDTRKSNDASKPGSQQPGQQPSRPPRLARTYSHDLPAFSLPKADRDPAILDFRPLGIEQTPSRNSSVRKKGEHMVPMTMSWS